MPLAHCGALPPPSPTIVHVGGEQFPQPVDVAVPEGVEEPRRQLLALLAVGLEPGPARVHVAPRPHRELAARRLRPAHRRRDLGEAEPEHLPQHEDRPLERAEPLEQQQGRHRHRVGQLRRPLPGPRTGRSSSGSGNHGPTYSSRRTRAERSTSIEIRVTTAERKALVDVGWVGEAS